LAFYKKILDDALIMKEEHASSFKLLTNVERYKQFLAQYPGLEKRVKQYQLASFLGSRLSRLAELEVHFFLTNDNAYILHRDYSYLTEVYV
jgi:ribosome-associated toxin RatA of RatAB toxin-antitoxin module